MFFSKKVGLRNVSNKLIRFVFAQLPLKREYDHFILEFNTTVQ